MRSMNKTDKIFIAGHLGMVGSAIHRLLQEKGFSNVLVAPKSELDLLDQQKVRSFFESVKT